MTAGVVACAAGPGGSAGRMLTPGRTVQRITVGIAEYKVARHVPPPNGPDATILASYGLGSCVGVVLHDAEAEVAGLAHILLPAAQRDDAGRVIGNPRKYADTCVAAMLDDIEAAGGSRERLRAKIAGGASMFPAGQADYYPRPPGEFRDRASSAPVGARNVAAVRAVLTELRVPVAAEDTGGRRGRSLEFDIGAGVLTILTAHAGDTTL